MSLQPESEPYYVAPMSFWRQLRIWFAIGLQSFGGGMVTFALIQRVAVDRYEWVTAEEFARDWALVQIAPGINLVALTILIGKRAGGYAGVVAALAGLLIPSVIITILISAVYDRLHRIGLVNRALAGAIPAVLGIGLAAGLAFVKPVFDRCRGRSLGDLAIAIALFVGSGIAEAYHASVVGVLLGVGAISAALTWISGGAHGAGDGEAA